MGIFLTFAALIILGISIVQIGSHKNQKPESTGEPISENLSVTPTPLNSPVPTKIFYIATPKPTASPFPNSQQISNGDFIYPDSTKISADVQNVILNSNDDPGTITDWYKNRIKSQGFSATSFITTNSNGVILNKLAGSKNGQTIIVEISKNNNQTPVKITISS